MNVSCQSDGRVSECCEQPLNIDSELQCVCVSEMSARGVVCAVLLATLPAALLATLEPADDDSDDASFMVSTAAYLRHSRT